MYDYNTSELKTDNKKKQKKNKLNCALCCGDNIKRAREREQSEFTSICMLSQYSQMHSTLLKIFVNNLILIVYQELF